MTAGQGRVTNRRLDMRLRENRQPRYDLGTAWHECEAALPPGWRFGVTPYFPNGWEAEAHDLEFQPGHGKHGTAAFWGINPVEALQALTDSLRAREAQKEPQP